MTPEKPRSASERRRRRLPELLAIALALPAIAALTYSATPAYASTPAAAGLSHVASHVQRAQTARPMGFIGCFFGVDKPFWLRAGGPLYAKGGITRCTIPPPDECKLEVELEENGIGIFDTWGVVGNPKSSGYVRCSAKVTESTNYRCRSVIARREFRTLAILTTVYRGVPAASHIYSATEYEWCE